MAAAAAGNEIISPTYVFDEMPIQPFKEPAHRQHDPHELFTFVWNEMLTDDIGIWHGRQTLQHYCQNDKCTQPPSTFIDLFSSLSLHLPSSNTSIQNMIDQHLMPHQLAKCDKCNGGMVFQKTIINCMPKTLFLNILTYKWNDNRKIKLFKPIAINDRIELEMNGEIISYLFKSVIVHEGPNADTGHYFTIVKIDGKYVEFNDARISVRDSLEVELTKLQMPYILCYEEQRRDSQLDRVPPKGTQTEREIR